MNVYSTGQGNGKKKLIHVYVRVGVYMLSYTVEEGRGGAGITRPVAIG